MHSYDSSNATEPAKDNTLGKFRVLGVRKEDGSDVELMIDAQSSANAKVKGDIQGVIVTRIEAPAAGTTQPVVHVFHRGRNPCQYLATNNPAGNSGLE